MTTRLSLLSAALLSLLLGAGCREPNELPQAPEPRPKGEKTNAELLVGKWKFVKQTPPMLNKRYQLTIEYTADGKVIMRHDNPADDPRVLVESGTYRVEGNTLFHTMDRSPKEWSGTIDSITEDKLVTSATLEGELYVGEYERVRGK